MEMPCQQGDGCLRHPSLSADAESSKDSDFNHSQDDVARPPSQAVAPRSVQGPESLPDDWRSTPPGRAYIAAIQVQDTSAPFPSGKEPSHFLGQPLESPGEFRPNQRRHIKATYALARYLLGEENDGVISEACRIPLGYIRQLLYTGIQLEKETAMASDAVIAKARSDYNVLPFAGIPLTGCSISLRIVQFKRLEETHQRLVKGVDQMNKDKNYNFLLAI